MKMHKTVLIIGISGVTCGGKTTTSTKLTKLLPNAKLFSQDDYFLNVDDKRHTWIPELNHINFDILSSLDMERMHLDILNYIGDKKIMEINLDKINTQNGCSYHKAEENVLKLQRKLKDNDIGVVIVEGFSIFNYEPMLELFHLKYYFTLSRQECYKRRTQRVYEPPDCPGYFEKCVWPEHVKQLEEIRSTVDNVNYFNECVVKPEEKIITDILLVCN